MPPLGQLWWRSRGGARLPGSRSWIAVGPAEFMFSPRRWVSEDSHIERSLGAEMQAESGRESEKEKRQWPCIPTGLEGEVKRKSARMRFIVSPSRRAVTPGHQISPRSRSEEHTSEL